MKYPTENQIAHDIRGPLATLQTVVAGLARLGETERALLQDACQRLERLADSLVSPTLRRASDLPLNTPESTASPSISTLIVLIDDDPLVHMTWKFGLQKSAVELRTFFSPEYFLESAASFGRSTPIYVDVHLGQGLNGVAASKSISELGFTSVYLTSGSHELLELSTMPWLRGVMGKEAPVLK